MSATLVNLRVPDVHVTPRDNGERVVYDLACRTCRVRVAGWRSEEAARDHGRHHRCHDGSYRLDNKSWHGQHGEMV